MADATIKVELEGGRAGGGSPSSDRAMSDIKGLLGKVTGYMSDFPLWTAVLKILKLIALIILMPLAPILKKAIQFLADAAVWLNETKLGQIVATGLAGLVAAITALVLFLKGAEFVDKLSRIFGGGGILGGGGGLGGTVGNAAGGLLVKLGSFLSGFILPITLLAIGSAAAIAIGGALANALGAAPKTMPVSDEDINKYARSQPGQTGGTTPLTMDPITGKWRIVQEQNIKLDLDYQNVTKKVNEQQKKVAPVVNEMVSSIEGTGKPFDFFQHGLETAGTSALEFVGSLATANTRISLMQQDATTRWIASVKQMEQDLGIPMTGEHTVSGINYASGAVGAAIMANLSSASGRGGGLMGVGQATAGALSGASASGSYGAGSPTASGMGSHRQIGGVVGEEDWYYLHRGEQVNSATEGKQGGGGGSPVINITVNSPSVRNDGDIKELVRQISREMQSTFRRYTSYGPNG